MDASASTAGLVLNKPLIEEFKARMAREKLVFGRAAQLDLDVFIQRFINAREAEKNAKEASWKMLVATLKVRHRYPCATAADRWLGVAVARGGPCRHHRRCVWRRRAWAADVACAEWFPKTDAGKQILGYWPQQEMGVDARSGMPVVCEQLTLLDPSVLLCSFESLGAGGAAATVRAVDWGADLINYHIYVMERSLVRCHASGVMGTLVVQVSARESCAWRALTGRLSRSAWRGWPCTTFTRYCDDDDDEICWLVPSSDLTACRARLTCSSRCLPWTPRTTPRRSARCTSSRRRRCSPFSTRCWRLLLMRVRGALGGYRHARSLTAVRIAGTREKIRVFGAEYLQHVPAECLPPKWGGTSPIEWTKMVRTHCTV